MNYRKTVNAVTLAMATRQ